MPGPAIFWDFSDIRTHIPDRNSSFSKSWTRVTKFQELSPGLLPPCISVRIPVTRSGCRSSQKDLMNDDDMKNGRDQESLYIFGNILLS